MWVGFMNIFVLDYDLGRCVESAVDRHVSKMVLETAQLLCTSLNLVGVKTAYRSCHMNHPCRLWAGRSRSNFNWLCEYGLLLGKEYTYRYGKVHKSEGVIRECMELAGSIESGDLTEFAQAMPDEYKDIDAVTAYRRYYNGAKRHLFSWKGRTVPEWIIS